jgi:FG-GAP-like repeat
MKIAGAAGSRAVDTSRLHGHDEGDGRLDLFVACPDGGCKLFRNNGDGTFTDVAQKAGVQLKGRRCLGCAFGDVDGDGRDDLFVTCCESQASALFRNVGGGKFKEVTAEAGRELRGRGDVPRRQEGRAEASNRGAW